MLACTGHTLAAAPQCKPSRQDPGHLIAPFLKIARQACQACLSNGPMHVSWSWIPSPTHWRNWEFPEERSTRTFTSSTCLLSNAENVFNVISLRQAPTAHADHENCLSSDKTAHTVVSYQPHPDGDHMPDGY
eukprot:744459-Pelagomonas_calceolata.AAC.1